jgi:hypothetical protein
MFELGIFGFISLVKFASLMVTIAATLYVVKTVLGFFVGGAIGASIAKRLSKEDREWQR